ncbi:hypothetical protein EGW08_001213 [Elysia chlorotica]|uniref:TLDc domain-containing protein n=1 Tax=Elysia chlorotica TaxID=188477 RepID=A0A433UB24_ELYCH|nr:hypothetical protein EGW08_001213 [Elysia chlorotica]
MTELSAAGVAGDNSEREVFEHALELGVAFTEYVDVDSFKASLGNKNPHTEDGFGGRSEEHLVALLQSGATKNLKSYLRNSQWPAESDARRNQWMNLCGHLVKAGGGLYQELAKDALAQDSEETLSLPPFVDSEHLHSYHLNQHGIHTAKEVITVIANLSPDIIYCPLLYPLVCLFLHYMTPEACFDCVQALLAADRTLYLAQAKKNNEATALVLRDLAKKYTKQAYVLVVRSSKNVDAVFEPWIWWIFKDLPFQYLVRIIDSYLLEGYKVFFRVALSILILFTKDSNRRGSRNSPVTNISAAISRFCSSMPYEPKKLLKAGFSIRGLTRREIHKLQAKHEAYLRSLPATDELPAVASTLSAGQTSLSHSFNGPSYLLKTKTQILTPDMLHALWGWIPIRLTLKKLERLFSSEVDGTTLRTLYTRSQHAQHTILVIKSTDGSIFGAFCSEPWFTRHEKNQPHMSFFGTGETFVFTMYPSMKKFPWAGATVQTRGHTSDHFMAGDDTMLIIGSGNGEAIYLDNMMSSCRSTHCDTFVNEPLCEAQDFSCQVVEVFGFVD